MTTPLNEPKVSATRRKESRRFMVGAVLVAAVAFGVIAWGGINRNLVYYWTPTDLHKAGDKAYGATIRLGGMVVPGSIRKPEGISGLEFDVRDVAGVVHVKSSGVPPQMFRGNVGVVVEGTMVQGGYFECHRLMVAHNNQYKPPAKGHPVDRRELEKLMRSTNGLNE